MAELDTKKIVAGIEKLFADNNHFVFWYDAQGEFADNIADITEQLREPVVIMGENEQFKTKLTLVAMEQQGQSALVYSPAPKPDLTENFMTDMLYYSREYTANALVMSAGRGGRDLPGAETVVCQQRPPGQISETLSAGQGFADGHHGCAGRGQ